MPHEASLHQHFPCHSDELFPLETLTGLARGGPIKGPEIGPDSGITAMITNGTVITAVKPKSVPDYGP